MPTSNTNTKSRLVWSGLPSSKYLQLLNIMHGGCYWMKGGCSGSTATEWKANQVAMMVVVAYQQQLWPHVRPFFAWNFVRKAGTVLCKAHGRKLMTSVRGTTVTHDPIAILKGPLCYDGNIRTLNKKWFFFFFLCIPNDVISNSLNSNQLFINYRYVVIHTSLVFVKLSTRLCLI